MSSMLPPGLGALPPHPPMPSGGQLPPGIASLVSHIPPDSDAPHGGGKDELSVLQDTIEDFPPLIHALSDAGDVSDAVKALHILTGIQKRLMQGSAPGAPPR